MKQVFFILSFLLILSCTSTKQTFWCGDHACANKQEKDEYFNKTMIVEIKEVRKNKPLSKSNIEIIKEQNEIVKKNKKKIISNKIEEDLIKQEQKELAEQAKIEADLIKQESKHFKNKKKIPQLSNVDIASNSFEKIVEKISIKNSFRPYPNINDIPN